MKSLVHNWDIPAWWCYVLSVLFVSLVIRLVTSLLRSLERAPQYDEKFWSFFRHDICGYHPKKHLRDASDRWIPVILGTIELFAYPVLMAVGAWNAIGAWIGLKTLTRFRSWLDDRSPFNRYLIGNALVLIASLFLAHYFVRVGG